MEHQAGGSRGGIVFFCPLLSPGTELFGQGIAIVERISRFCKSHAGTGCQPFHAGFLQNAPQFAFTGVFLELFHEFRNIFYCEVPADDGGHVVSAQYDRSDGYGSLPASFRAYLPESVVGSCDGRTVQCMGEPFEIVYLMSDFLYDLSQAVAVGMDDGYPVVLPCHLGYFKRNGSACL